MKQITRLDDAELTELLKELQRAPENTDEAQRLLHELHVHQIELEQQNRQLQDVQMELEASRDRYAELYDFAPVAYLTLEATGLIREINLAGAALLGWERQTLIGTFLPHYVVPEQRQLLRSYLRRLLDTGAQEKPIFSLTRKDGQLLQVLSEGSASPPASGLCHIALVDITATQRAEQALRASERNYRRLADHSTDMISTHDAAGVYRYVSPSCGTLLGYEAEDLLGRSAYDFFHPDDLQAIRKSHQAITSGPLIYTVQYRIRRKDGEYVWFETNSHVIEDLTDGDSGVILAQSREITERERLERELRQSRKMEALGQLTGGIAHDFNNMLASILGFTQLAMEQGERISWEKVRGYLAQIEIAGRRGAELVAQMLTFARSNPQQNRKPVDIGPLVKEVARMLESVLPSSITLGIEISSHPQQTEIDPVQLHQLLLNLCLNARDAMSDKGRLVIRLHDVDIAPQECNACHKPVSGHWLELSVTDSGQGMSRETLQRIFDPFFTTKEIGKGSGMGLSVVHGIVTAAGGHIMVQTAAGKGACFRILLPPSHAPAQQVVEDAADVPVPQGQGQRIMIIDDEPALAMFLSECVRLYGYQTVMLTDSRQALQQLTNPEHDIALLITDQTMPAITGTELAAAVRRTRPELPIILCSGYSKEVSAETASAAGIDHYQPKPIDCEELLRTISRIFQEADDTTGPLAPRGLMAPAEVDWR